MSSAFLKTFYDRIDQDQSPISRQSREAKDSLNNHEEDAPKQIVLPRLVFLQAGMTTLSVGAIVTVLLLARGAMRSCSWEWLLEWLSFIAFLPCALPTPGMVNFAWPSFWPT